MRSLAWTVLMAIAFGAGAAGLNSEYNPVRTHPHGAADAAVERLIIKLRSAGGSAAVTAAAASPEEALIEAGRQRAAVLAGHHGLALKMIRPITARMHVMHLEPSLGAESVASTLDALRADPEVEYAEVDQRRYAHATPNDSLFLTQQWYLQNSATTPTTPASIDAMTAWDTTTGSSTMVIADLDTGVRYDHPDLLATSSPGGRLLPGYCFISDAFTANNTTCPGPDASDPGDWVASSDITSHPSECSGATASNSSWHGTRTAGLIGAITNNNTGIAGVTWQGQILPVRVLGKCGGFDSDILNAMLWAAGISVAGAPANTQPARVINMSFGATSTCPSTYTDVINQVTAKGVLVVVSAGNEGGPVDAPANCPGVAAVAGIRHVGTKVGYSSLGPEIALSAPAGNCVNTAPGSTCLYPITTTFNTGTTTANPAPAGDTYTDQVNNPNLGTSFSAPLVSGIGALMAATNSGLNSCRLISRLKEGALPFPQTSTTATTMCHVPSGASDIQGSECICTLDGRTCGAGMANAPGALKAAVRPVAAVTVPLTVTAGQAVALQGGASAAMAGHTITTYQWVSVGTQSLTVQGGSTSTATVTPPSCGLGTVRLTVTDDLNRQDTADVVISPTAATTTAPSTVSATGACSTAPATIQVAVCPTTASVQAGGAAQTFTATLGNTSNTAVTWQVNTVTGGSATTGTISTTGVYTPPASVPSPATVTISAVSVADPTQQAGGQVTVTALPGLAGGGGGGGGALDLLSLVTLALGALAQGGLRARPT
jgi:serine protease